MYGIIALKYGVDSVISCDTVSSASLGMGVSLVSTIFLDDGLQNLGPSVSDAGKNTRMNALSHE